MNPDNPGAVAVVEDFVAEPHKPLIGRMGGLAEPTGPARRCPSRQSFRRIGQEIYFRQ
jgi:hypothetical protein